MSFDPFPEVARACLAVLTGGLLLAGLRLVLGPTIPDRVVALDLVGVIAIGVIAVYAAVMDVHFLLYPATVLAVVAFIATAAFAGSLERGRT